MGDGEAWIAYQWVAGSGDGVYLVRPDGTGNHQLVMDLTGSEIHPDWSPDGTQIAFARQTPEGTVELWVVDGDGTDPERLHLCESPCNQLDYPDWSPDGASIYFSYDADVPPGEELPRTFGVGRVDVRDGAAHVVLSHEDGTIVWQPRVSPDGTSLAYLAGNEELGGAIFVSPVAGGAETQLTDYDLLASHPDWTPDGRIVFQTHDLGIFPNTTEAANLFIMDADGSHLEQLTEFAEGDARPSQPRVAPDGSGVVYTQQDSSGARTRQMAFLEFGQVEPRWLTPTPLSGTHAQLRPLPSD